MGGVLVYGIPIPPPEGGSCVPIQSRGVERLGVEIENRHVVGRTVTIGFRCHSRGYDAIFISSGAGLPLHKASGGGTSTAVTVSRQQNSTRANLMHAHDRVRHPIVRQRASSKVVSSAAATRRWTPCARRKQLGAAIVCSEKAPARVRGSTTPRRALFPAC